MRRMICMSVALLVLASISAGAAQKKNPKADWPKPAAIEKANEDVKYLTNRQVQAKYRGRLMTFIPADVSGISDEQKYKGFIIGKLISEGVSADKLPAGQYTVYVRKPGPAWEAYFTQKNEPVAKSTEVRPGDEDFRTPDFTIDNTTFRYWKLRIAY